MREEGKKQCFSDFDAHGIHLTSLLKCTVGILTSSKITQKLPGHGHALVARSLHDQKHGKINGRKFLPSCIYLPLNPSATTHFWENLGLFLIPGRLPSLRVEENLFTAVQVKVLSNSTAPLQVPSLHWNHSKDYNASVYLVFLGNNAIISGA